MSGITKVIDELGTIIIAKNIELSEKQEEIDALRKKIDIIEQYLDTYDTMYDYQQEIYKRS